MRQQRLSVTLAAVGAAVAVVVACSGGTVTPGQDASVDTDAAPVGPCPGGLTDCGGGKCAQLKRDPDNCGKCGQACKAGEFCVQGSCSFTCGGGTTRCGALCANVKTDAANCGQCGSKCTAGQVCNMGTCAATCQATLTACGQSCVDLTSDDDNCGACGTACDPGQRCTAGKCQASCQAGWTSCPTDGGTSCVDVKNDPNNCGACNNKCANGWFCTPTGDGGAPGCQIQCFGGTTLCNGKCADTSMDPANCGGCNAACGMNQVCTSGHCCAAGEGYCNGACRPANQCGVVYTGNFTQGQWNQQQCTDWNTWRALLVGNYTSVTIKGSQDPTGVTCTGANANTLCQALRNNLTVSMVCDGRTWGTGTCGSGSELTASGSVCQCTNSGGYTARPCIGANNPNWGGVNTTTCSAVTQTITVVCQ